MKLRSLLRDERGGFPSVMESNLMILVALVAIITIIVPTCNANRIKKYNAAAKAELSNTRTCVEQYWTDQRPAYPETLAAAACPQPAADIALQYTRTSKHAFKIICSHRDGDREFRAVSTASEVSSREKNIPGAKWIENY